MKEEIKNLLHRLLWSIVESGKAGINNAIQESSIEEVIAEAKYEFNYTIKALKELKKLEKGNPVCAKNIKDAMMCSIRHPVDTDELIWSHLDFGFSKAKEDFTDEELTKEKLHELYQMYHPSDELMNELVEMLDN